jgi:hypothetical protein
MTLSRAAPWHFNDVGKIGREIAQRFVLFYGQSMADEMPQIPAFAWEIGCGGWI